MPAEKKDAKDSRCKTPAAGRLKGGKVFDALFRKGGRINGKLLTVIAARDRGSDGEVAVIVPRRLGGAVERNRARRVLREHLRQNPHPSLSGRKIIILCRARVTESYLIEAKKELENLLDRISR